MTPRAAHTLRGPDAAIVDLVAHLCAIVRRRGLGTTADVARVVATYLPPAVDNRYAERIVALTARAEEAEFRADQAERQMRRQQQASTQLPVPRRSQQARHVHLPPREAEVLRLLADGYTYQEIGDRLGATVHAVTCTTARMVHNVGAADRTQAVAWLHLGVINVAVRDLRKARAVA